MAASLNLKTFLLPSVLDPRSQMKEAARKDRCRSDMPGRSPFSYTLTSSVWRLPDFAC